MVNTDEGRSYSGYNHSFHAKLEEIKQELELEDKGEISDLLKKFWEVEEVSATDFHMSPYDRKVYDKTLQSMTYDGERYTVSIPFNEKKIEEPSDAQRKGFAEEYKQILTGEPLKSEKSKLAGLNPKLDGEGIMRMDERLSQEDGLPWETKKPAILPRRNHVTDLIIIEAHGESDHTAGSNQLLAILRRRYWILAGREQIRGVLHRCMVCRRRAHKALCQQMGLLPKERTEIPLRAFTNVGVDFCGPFLVKMGRGRPQLKRWICLFTCLSVRAVHLEICWSLDVSSFLNALTRFMARRGVPKVIVSDNGTNLVGANNELQELFKSQKPQHFRSEKKIGWKFNPLSAPHHGGMFESMIKAAKHAMQETLRKKDLQDEELLTAALGAEAIINSRPLTYVSNHPKDPTVLTPNHFLHGSLGGMIAPEVIDGTPTYQKRWRLIQELLHQFWQRWAEEWLPEKNVRTKWQKMHANLKEGDVVILLDEVASQPHGHFPLGRVKKVYYGGDGNVRVCDVVRGRDGNEL